MQFSLHIFANEENLTEEIDFNLEEISGGIPNENLEILDEYQIEIEDPTSFAKITFFDVIKYVFDEFTAKLKLPITTFLSLISVIIVSALAKTIGGTVGNSTYEKMFEYFTILVSIGVIISPISDSVNKTADVLRSGGEFMITYVPIFSGIVASSGHLTSATIYNVSLVSFAEIVVQFLSSVIVPILSVSMALGVIESINPTIKLSSLTFGITKGVKIILGFITTIFIGLLSLQTIVGASADSLGVKATKYLASNFIPIIGGAVADSYSTLKLSLGVLRGGVGFYGIIVLFLILVPPLLELVAFTLILKCSEIISDVFDIKSVGVLLKNSVNVMTIMISVMIFFSMLMIISTSTVMLIGLDSM